MNELKKYDDVSLDVNALTGEIVDCFFQVHKELGAGYHEKIYEEACIEEFETKGLSYAQQKQYQIIYKGKQLKSILQPDLIIEDQILIELKAVEKIHPVHQSQVYSYLKATQLPIGFLVNFNVPLIKDGISRFKNKYSEPQKLRVENEEGQS